MAKSNTPTHPLAIEALRALHGEDYVKEPGMCQKFVRQVIYRTYGGGYERFREATAAQTAARWQQSEFAHPGGSWGIVGDIYYWYGSPGQPQGHTAIRIPGNKVAENSTVHGGDGDGRGTRSLTQLRSKPDLIVRLPAKK